MNSNGSASRNSSLRDAIEKLDRRIEQLRDVQHEAARMCDAWAPFLQLSHLRRQQTGAGDMKLSAAQWDEAKKLTLQRQQLIDSERKLTSVIERRAAEHRQLSDQRHDEILAHQAHVQALQLETGRMQEYAEQLPRLRREQEEQTHQLRAHLRGLNLGWAPERLEQTPSGSSIAAAAVERRSRRARQEPATGRGEKAGA